MLQVRQRLEAGYLVGILADRSLDSEHGEPVDFLGSAAPFPQGPFRMAALLRGPVYFMAALYGGGKRYDVYFEPLIDYEIVLGKGGAGVSAGVRQYAQTLARYCRLSPFNWFNFFDFWHGSR
jgi:predicted LPLAT superfamily acyltransferase